MCFKRKDKWKDFEPTKDYISIVKGLTSVTKLHTYIKKIEYVSDKKDYWQIPIETINRGKGDCEDYARLAIDVLVRVIGIDGARFIVHGGYDYERWGENKKGHAICVFPYQGKLAMFSNDEFKSGFDNYEEAGKITFKDGLKYQEVRDWNGKILEKKRKLFGTF